MKNLLIIILFVTVCNPLLAQVPAYVPTAGLLAWYPLDSSLTNAHGAPMNNGAARGAVGYGTDRFGVANHAYRGNAHSLCNIPVHNFPKGNSARTVSLFFRLDTAVVGGGRSLMSWGGNSFGTRFGVFAADTMVGVEYVNAYVARHFNGDSQWHNLIVTYPAGGAGSSSIKIYYDGVLSTSLYIKSPISTFNTDTGVWHDIGGSIYFGSAYSDSWHGYIDDVGIWDRELTACEAEQMANSGPLHPLVTVSGHTLSAAATYVTYQWFSTAGTISGATSNTYYAPLSGSYKIVVTDSSGCSDTSVVVSISTLAVNGYPATGSEIVIYPNPAQSVFHISAPFPVNVSISDAFGKTVIKKTEASEIDMSGLPAGVYVLSVFDSKGVKIKSERMAWRGK